MSKIILYCLVLPIVIYTFESIDINIIFKKNKQFQAKVLYVLFVLALSYLVVNFFYDVFY